MFVETSGTPVRLKVRRRCLDCPKVLVGQGARRCFDCREVERERAATGRRRCIECGDPIMGRRGRHCRAKRCTACLREQRREIVASWRRRNRDKINGYNRKYYARLRAEGWRDPTGKARNKRHRDKTRKNVYAPRRSRAVMWELRAMAA